MEEEKKEQEQKEEVNALVIDSVLEKPITFTIDGHFFFIYPPSIGVTMVSASVYAELGIDVNMFALRKEFEILRLAIEKKDTMIRLIALHSFKHRQDCMNEELVDARIKALSKLTPPDISAIGAMMFEWSTYQDRFIKAFELDKEREKRSAITAKKKDKGSSVTFGGRSLYGALIDFACERYGWHVDYVLWGVSATTLNMMMADSVNSVYLTEEERKGLNIPKDGKVIKQGDVRSLLALAKQVNK